MGPFQLAETIRIYLCSHTFTMEGCVTCMSIKGAAVSARDQDIWVRLAVDLAAGRDPVAVDQAVDRAHGWERVDRAVGRAHVWDRVDQAVGQDPVVSRAAADPPVPADNQVILVQCGAACLKQWLINAAVVGPLQVIATRAVCHRVPIQQIFGPTLQLGVLQSRRLRMV